MQKKIMKIKNDTKFWNKSLKYIPGGNTLISKRPNLWLPNLWPTHFSSSKGINIKTSGGKNYKDFLFAVGTNTLGYSNSKIDNAVISSIKKGVMTSLNCIDELELAEKLTNLHKWSDMVKFTRGGGEANSLAIRLARAASGKNNIAFCGYHGWHDWYLATNLQSKNNLNNHLIKGIDTSGVNSKLKGTIFSFNYNNFNKLKKLVEEKSIGTVIMEVKRYLEPENDFLRKVRELCTRKGVVLIFDECTSGFRQTFGGLHKQYKVNPDMAMFGKALGNGYAINAVVGKKDVMMQANNSFISSTFWGERVGFAAANKTLEVMKKIKSWEIITNNGKYIQKRWKEIFSHYKLKVDIMGIPALSTFQFKSENNLKYRSIITQEMLKKNILASNLIYVSILHTPKTMEEYFLQFEKIIKLINKFENGTENLDKYLKTGIAKETFERLN